MELLPGLASLGLSTPVQRGYSPLFAGLVIAEMTRTDTSIATFFMVHHDLFVEGLHAFGSEEQKERLLADAQSLQITGAFALTEPDHGSDVAGGMATTAVRDGDSWILNGSKRWIGNGTFCDWMLLLGAGTGRPARSGASSWMHHCPGSSAPGSRTRRRCAPCRMPTLS